MRNRDMHLTYKSPLACILKLQPTCMHLTLAIISAPCKALQLCLPLGKGGCGFTKHSNLQLGHSCSPNELQAIRVAFIMH